MSNLRPCTYCKREPGESCAIDGGCVVPLAARNDPGLQQGYFQKGPISPPPRWMRILGWGLVAVLFALSMLSSGCTVPGPLRVAEVGGTLTTFHPDDLTACNGGASACTLKVQACPEYQIYYSTIDESALGHEEEHVMGMRHREPWVTVAGKVCTVVTDGGATSWHKGEVMCRIDAGPPVKITDARVRTYVLETR